MKILNYFYTFLLLTVSCSVYAQNNYSSPKDWMKFIDDNKYIGELFIPGTHDSGTSTIRFNENILTYNFLHTQSATIQQQLNMGVRFFDIRINTDNFAIYHDTANAHLSFEKVLNEFVDFIQKHPSETVLVQLKKEGGGSSNKVMYDTIFNKYIVKYQPVEHYFVMSDMDSSPQLKDLRGKILFIKRRGVESTKSYGLNVNYQDNTIFKALPFFYIQDAYNPAGDCRKHLSSACISWDRVHPKQRNIDAIIHHRLEHPRTNTIYINFISLAAPESTDAITENPEYYAIGKGGLNDYAIAKARRLKNAKANGNIFLFDFINTGYSKEIIDLNF